MLTARACKYLLVSFALSASLLLGGALANQLAQAVNHGYMPVEMSTGMCPEGLVIDDNHVCYSPSMNLAVLDDWFYYDGMIYSPGDGGIVLGQYGTMTTIIAMGVVAIPFRRRK